LLGENGTLRTAVIFFYLSNEGLSILENAGALGIPIPAKLAEMIAKLRDKPADKSNQPSPDNPEDKEG
jgi:phage-related holin